MKLISLKKFAICFLVLYITINKVKCVKKINIVKTTNPKIQNTVLPYTRRKKYFVINLFNKLQQLRKCNTLKEEISMNKKKNMINLVYKDIIKKNEKPILNKLEHILKKQQNTRFSVFFNEFMHNFHNNFLYYYIFFYVLRINEYIHIIKKINKFLATKLKINLLNNTIHNMTIFEKKYIWNKKRIHKFFENKFKKINIELNNMLNRHLSNYEYHYYSTLDEGKSFDHKNFHDIDDKLIQYLYNTYGLYFHAMFNNKFLLPSLNIITRLINTNIQIFLLKNFNTDKYTANKVMHTYKTFFTLTAKNNTIPLFIPFQDNRKLVENYHSTLDAIVKKHINIDIPNLKLLNVLNLSLILLKLLIRKIIQLLLYYTLLYSRKYIYQKIPFIKDIFSFSYQ
ncbi:conserved Plasmodium protein, unknown function [Plasmodium chabaudi adami]|uniref:Uncharacterized protein n=1 Tax=Plasmodium chabaudi adami TaxID=5826 RepID=A0A1C6XAQ7_PLACE|nr:conserved Plasmodium protein, unknown function [Plasmodium chabaudi adami]